ncbi:hypothetical protein ACJMK2_044054 [Sinanodonta woodiana]
METDSNKCNTNPSIKPEQEASVDFGKMFNTVTEGKATVFQPRSVFYNPVQEFNRDLTIAVISQFSREHFDSLRIRQEKRNLQSKPPSKETVDSGDKQEGQNHEIPDILKAGVRYENGLRILEGLAASGLRSIRFGLEIPGVKEVISNDFDQSAVEIIRKNVLNNNLQSIVHENYGDAAMVMYQNKGLKDRFDVIDLDPYGSASHFFDAAVQAVSEGGLLCVTCTDAAVLCGNAGETCYAKYGAMSLRAKYCHEMGLRILLQCIESHANRYSRYIEPLLSVSVDFYMRVFVKVFTGQGKVKRSVSKMAMVYNCTGCGSFVLQRLGQTIPTKGGNFKYSPATGPPVGERCNHCGFKHQLGGPIWAEAIHNVDFVNKVINNVRETPELFGTAKRIEGMLSVTTEELPVPLYYITDELSSILHCTPPTLMQIRSAILNAGYKVSMSHAAKNSNKTDAPNHVIWDIMRAWIKGHPIHERHLKPGTPSAAILAKEATINVNFDIHPEANPKSRQQGLVRWQQNPEPDWGPKSRAKKTDDENSQTVDKREKNQGHRKRKAEQSENGPDKKFPCEFDQEGDEGHNISRINPPTENIDSEGKNI